MAVLARAWRAAKGAVLGYVIFGGLYSFSGGRDRFADEVAWPLAAIAVALGLCLGWRWPRKAAEPPDTTHGSARFGSARRARAALGGPDGVILGRADEGWLLRYAGPRHLLTFAPTRSGKGVGVILPNLLATPRPMLCVDPKGENARIAAAARRRYGPVHVLDPFGVSGQPACAFNPLAQIAPLGPDLSDDAARIAEAIVYDPPELVGEAHWNEEAKALIAGSILHLLTRPPPGGATLADLRDLLTSAPERFAATLKAMQASNAADGLVARAANRHLGKSDREASGVLSAAQRHTHFLDSRRITDSLARSDFLFRDLRQGSSAVFLVLPPERLATHSRWLRLLITEALHDLARPPPPGQVTPAPVLFLLDEFAALGRMEPIVQAFGLMAGYGVQLWPLLQDLHQLRALYGGRAGVFLANAGVTQVFNVADVQTAEWVSRSLGVTTESAWVPSQSTSTGGGWSMGGPSTNDSSGQSWTLQPVRRELLTPDEVITLRDDLMILLRPGRSPLIARKLRHYADPEFVGLLVA